MSANTKTKTNTIAQTPSPCSNLKSVKSSVIRVQVRGRRGRAWMLPNPILSPSQGGGDTTSSTSGIRGIRMGKGRTQNHPPRLLEIIAHQEKERIRDMNLDIALRKKHASVRVRVSDMNGSQASSSSVLHSVAQPQLNGGPHHPNRRRRRRWHRPNNKVQTPNKPSNLDLDLDHIPDSNSNSNLTSKANAYATHLAEVSRKADIIIRAWETMYAATYNDAASDNNNDRATQAATSKGGVNPNNKWAFVDAALINVRDGYRPYTEGHAESGGWCVPMYNLSGGTWCERGKCNDDGKGKGRKEVEEENEEEEEVSYLYNPYSPKIQ